MNVRSSKRALAAPILLALLALCALAPAAFAEESKPAWKIVAAIGPTNLPPTQSEVQKLTVKAEGGQFALTYEGEEATLDFNASAAQVQASLEALPAIGAGNVNVSGGPGGEASDPYFVAFTGEKADTDVEAISAEGEALTGEPPYASVFTTLQGGNGSGELAVFAANTGAVQTSPGATLALGPLPAGVAFSGPAKGGGWSCDQQRRLAQLQRSSPTIPRAVAEPHRRPGRGHQRSTALGHRPRDDRRRRGELGLLPDAPGRLPPAGQARRRRLLGRRLRQTTAPPPTRPGPTPSAPSPTSSSTPCAPPRARSPRGGGQGHLRRHPAGLPRQPDGAAPLPAVEHDLRGRTSLGALSAFTGFGDEGFKGTTSFSNDVPAYGYAAQFTTKVVSPLAILLGTVRSAVRLRGSHLRPPRGLDLRKALQVLRRARRLPRPARTARPSSPCSPTAPKRQGSSARSKSSFDTWQEPGNLFSRLRPPAAGDRLREAPLLARASASSRPPPRAPRESAPPPTCTCPRKA